MVSRVWRCDNGPMVEQDGVRRDEPTVEPTVEHGGDSACWLANVCPECGRFVAAEPPTTCPRCGTSVDPD